MANSLALSANEIAGLGTFSYTIPVGADGLYTLGCQSTIPIGSALQIVLSQTGSASVSITIGGSSTNPTPTQPSMGTSGRFQCAAGDVMSVVLSSANAVDSNPNAVKSIANLYIGY